MTTTTNKTNANTNTTAIVKVPDEKVIQTITNVNLEGETSMNANTTTDIKENEIKENDKPTNKKSSAKKNSKQTSKKKAESKKLTEEQLGQMMDATIQGEENDDFTSVEDEEEVPETKFEWTCQRMTAKELMKMYKDEELLIPKCQRLYVWSDRQTNELLETIRQGTPFGDITVGEVDGVLYLGDGFQRVTTLMKLYEDESLTENIKKEIAEYELNVVTVHNMNWTAFNDYFRKRNNGTPLASAVKERAGLTDTMSQTILNISSNPFFRTGKFKSIFTKNQQQEIIAMVSLVAAAGMKTDCKAKPLAKFLNDNQDLILQHKDEAEKLVARVIDGFKNLDDVYVKRGFTANYVNAWLYALKKHPEYTSDDIAYATMEIFAKNVAIKEYRSTTSGASSSVSALDKRITVLEKMVKSIKNDK